MSMRSLAIANPKVAAAAVMSIVVTLGVAYHAVHLQTGTSGLPKGETHVHKGQPTSVSQPIVDESESKTAQMTVEIVPIDPDKVASVDMDPGTQWYHRSSSGNGSTVNDPPTLTQVREYVTALGREGECVDGTCQGPGNEWNVPHPPGGWFDDDEKKLLYVMGRYCPGPLIEQGPFKGLSTASFASGVRDSVLVDKQPKKVFLTTDVFPAHPDYAENELGYPFFWEKDSGKGKVDHGRTHHLYIRGRYVGSTGEWNDRISLVGGIHDEMVGSMYKNGLLDYVSVVTGDYYPNLPYRCGFFDTAHHGLEIISRLPDWIETIKLSGGKRQLLAFHDGFGFVGEPYANCNVIAGNIFDIRATDKFDNTVVHEVHGLRPNWQDAMNALPTPAKLQQVLFGDDAARSPTEQDITMDYGACATMCKRMVEVLGSAAVHTDWACSGGSSQKLYDRLFND